MKGGGAVARLLPACVFPFAVERVAVKKLCDGALLPEPKTVSCGKEKKLPDLTFGVWILGRNFNHGLGFWTVRIL